MLLFSVYFIMLPTTASPVRSKPTGGYFLKFGEIFLLSFIPSGLLLLVPKVNGWLDDIIAKPAVLLPVLMGMLLLSAALAWFWQKRKGGERLHTVFQTLIVLYLALNISEYGAAKILRTQFQPPHYVLERPLGELNGFWLTWTYYGFSPVMALILGWTQIAGSALILFRATRLAGIFILLPVMLNIDMVNYFYDISPGAFYNAMQFTLFLVVLLLIDLPVLKTIFLAYRDKLRIHHPRLLLNSLRLLVIVLAFWQVHRFKDSFAKRTRLNGVWQVDSLIQHRQRVIPAEHRGMVWSKLYFEWRYGCLFKYDPVLFQPKDLGGLYTVDEKAGLVRIGIYEGNTAKMDSMQFHYQFITDSTAVMRGVYKSDSLTLYLRSLLLDHR
jgi:hypothetical protein